MTYTKLPAKNGSIAPRQRNTGPLALLSSVSLSTKVLLLLLYLSSVLFLVWEYQHYLRGWGNEVLLGLAPPPNEPSSFVIYSNHCVHYDVIRPEITEFDRIAQILHISADMLDERIVEQVINWNAPVSLAVVLFTPEQYACTMMQLEGYRRDNPAMAANLRAHLVYPMEWSPNCTLPSSPVDFCARTEATARQVADYPANMARNIARLFSTTKYIVIADFEHLFSEGFEPRLREIAESQNDPKRVLVYRIFEVNKTVAAMPRTKLDLKSLYNDGAAVVFHGKIGSAHGIPRLTQWFVETNSTTGIFREGIRYNRYNWEPQFVAHRSIPFHDEAFPFLVRDNTVLRWELCRANYTFDVVSDHFMYHKGIKVIDKTSPKRKIRKWIQGKNARRFFRAVKAFRLRMDRQYNSTKKRCPYFMA